jgi:peptidoglycan/LPS O-acetylase OafA/YrhL
MKLSAIMKQPSAFLPVTMSLIALATVAVHVSIFGTAREADEGTAAHIWQLLMGLQIPIVAFFAIKWLPQAPRPASYVLALQILAALAALAPVFILGL